MKLILSLFVVVAVSVLSSLAYSAEPRKVLIISDIDDTLKVSHVLHPLYAAPRIPNYTVRFTGMSQLFQLLAAEPVAVTRFAYVSNALKEIAGITALGDAHRHFLVYNNFPGGVLSLRERLFDKDHKIREIRNQISIEKPDFVIFFGDNGQRDSEIYLQATRELQQKNIQTMTFIHQVYKTVPSVLDGAVFPEIGNKLLENQIGFVTPIEIALELRQNDLLSQSSLNWMIDHVAPNIVAEKFYYSDSINNIMFPSFMNCSEFVWRWPVTNELVPLVQKIKSACYGLF